MKTVVYFVNIFRLFPVYFCNILISSEKFEGKRILLVVLIWAQAKSTMNSSARAKAWDFWITTASAFDSNSVFHRYARDRSGGPDRRMAAGNDRDRLLTCVSGDDCNE